MCHLYIFASILVWAETRNGSEKSPKFKYSRKCRICVYLNMNYYDSLDEVFIQWNIYPIYIYIYMKYISNETKQNPEDCCRHLSFLQICGNTYHRPL